MTDIFTFGDLHFPYHHKPTVRRAFERLEEKPFDMIVQIGDLFDQYAFTRFPKKNVDLPQRELTYGRECAIAFWEEVKKRQPNAKCVQILGNHDLRMIKRAQEKFPEGQELVMVSFKELYKFEGVHSVMDATEEYVVEHSTQGKIAFIHGYKSKIGDHMRYLHMNVVHGHRHRGEVTYDRIHDRSLWELDAGYMADPDKEPLMYRESKTHKWHHGHGEIDKLGARFVAYNY